jgi:hypothetical protein
VQTATVNECTTDGEGQPGCTQDGWIDVPWVVGCEGPCCVGQGQEYSLNKAASTEIAQVQFDGVLPVGRLPEPIAVTIGLATAEGEKWFCAAVCVEVHDTPQCTTAVFEVRAHKRTAIAHFRPRTPVSPPWTARRMYV